VKILVLGAGRMGFAAVQDLARTGRAIELGVGDIDISRARSIAKKGGASAAHKVDVTRVDELAEILRGYDALINACWYEFNLHVMKACLKSGCQYNDLGGLFHMTRRQMALDMEFKKRGISAVIGGGESPGITNMMCALAAANLDAVERIRIFAGAREAPRRRDGGLIFPFSVSTVVDEYSKNPVQYLNGRYVEMEPMSGKEIVKFPMPVGKNKCYYSLHSEQATLPRTIGGVKTVEFKLGISDSFARILRPLIELGLTSEKKVPVDGTEISPKHFLVSFLNLRTRDADELKRSVALRTVVAGTRGRKGVTLVHDMVSAPRPSMGMNNATAYLTGVASSIFGQFLASGKVEEKGVLPPERAVDPRLFMHELKMREIAVAEREIRAERGP